MINFDGISDYVDINKNIIDNSVFTMDFWIECKKHEWELIHVVRYVTPRYGIYRCKKCGKTIKSDVEL